MEFLHLSNLISNQRFSPLQKHFLVISPFLQELQKEVKIFQSQPDQLQLPGSHLEY